MIELIAITFCVLTFLFGLALGVQFKCDAKDYEFTRKILNILEKEK